MFGLKNALLLGALGTSLAGCYAYAGPPRHTYHPRHERVVVVHERPRPAPVIVRERVVVKEDRRHRHHDDHHHD